MPNSIIREATISDLAAITALLEEANESAIEEIGRVAEEKCFGPGTTAGATTRLLFEGDILRGLSTVSGRTLRLLAVHSEARRRGFGSELLADAEERIMRAGHDRIVVAAAAGNYLVPGVNRQDRGTLSFFEHHGYRADQEDAIDMIVALPVSEAMETPAGVMIRRCRTEDREKLHEFISAEFAPAWAREVDLAFMNADPTCLIALRDGGLAGFSGWELNNRGLGTFGPQGVAEDQRGKGLGRVLLLSTLEALHRMGYERARIPWVSSVKYYQKSCGATVAAQYAQLSRQSR